jgi:DNA-binding response OmpR family regulator
MVRVLKCGINTPQRKSIIAHVLVIEDSPHVRFLIHKIVEAAGHQVEDANDGLDAMRLLYRKFKRFDLLILDMQMPKMNGAQFLDVVRRQSSTKTIPVIVLSAHPDLRDKIAQYETSAYLAKPIDRNLLVAEVNRLTHPVLT